MELKGMRIGSGDSLTWRNSLYRPLTKVKRETSGNKLITAKHLNSNFCIDYGHEVQEIL